MKTVTAIKSLRTWGLRGAIDFARRWPTLYSLRHSDRSKGKPPVRGITLIGPFLAPSGNAMTMRNFARRLKDASIPFQTFDMCDRATLPQSDYADILTPPRDFDLGKYDHVVELFTAHAPKSPSRHHALLAFWEFGEGFSYAFPDSARGEPLIAMSDFNADIFQRETPPGTPIFKIPHPIVFDDIKPVPSDRFTVFFNFDYGSSYYRKNPEAILRAFASAFPDKPDTRLVLKTSNAKRHPQTAQQLKSLAQELKLDSRLVLVEKTLSQDEMNSLFASCDVYISLHRGEGFGIGMVQAMALGKPVIASACTANLEFCRPEHSIQIPCRTVSIRPGELDNPAYRNVREWNEPDIRCAAQALRRLYDNPSLRTELGTKAKAFVNDHFSLKNFKDAVNAFLDAR